jgi:hypothetical protein
VFWTGSVTVAMGIEKDMEVSGGGDEEVIELFDDVKALARIGC